MVQLICSKTLATQFATDFTIKNANNLRTKYIGRTKKKKKKEKGIQLYTFIRNSYIFL